MIRFAWNAGWLTVSALIIVAVFALEAVAAIPRLALPRLTRAGEFAVDQMV